MNWMSVGTGNRWVSLILNRLYNPKYNTFGNVSPFNDRTKASTSPAPSLYDSVASSANNDDT